MKTTDYRKQIEEIVGRQMMAISRPDGSTEEVNINAGKVDQLLALIQEAQLKAIGEDEDPEFTCSGDCDTMEPHPHPHSYPEIDARNDLRAELRLQIKQADSRDYNKDNENV